MISYTLKAGHVLIYYTIVGCLKELKGFECSNINWLKRILADSC